MSSSKNKDEFLGIGIKFPFRINASTGKTALINGPELIEQNIHLLLSTRPGERIYHRNFGIDLTPLLFEIPNAATLKTIEENIISGLTQFQPMIVTESVDFEIIAEEGLIKIQIHFMIRSTNSRGNYVYPFYLKEANQF